MRQIIHIDGMCNECGNCATFCPYDSAPYMEKLTLFWSEADFNDSKNEGFLLLDDARQTYRVRLDGQVADYTLSESDGGMSAELAALIRAARRDYTYLF